MDVRLPTVEQLSFQFIRLYQRTLPEADLDCQVGIQVSPQMMYIDDYLPMVVCGIEKSR
jgi:hypothetical protein